MNSSFVEPSAVATVDLGPSPALLIDPRGADPIRACSWGWSGSRAMRG